MLKKWKKTSYGFILALLVVSVLLAVVVSKWGFLIYQKPRGTTNLQNKFYYGLNVEMSQILPGSKSYVVNEQGMDLIDQSAELGVNMFRITNQTRSFEDGKDAIYTKTQWYQVLNKMQEKGITAIILIEAASDNQEYYSMDLQPSYLDLVNKYVIESGVLDHQNVFGVDIKNEPVLTDNNISYMKKARDLIKAKYPNTKISIGWWRVDTLDKKENGEPMYKWDDYAAGKKLEEIVDYYSLHMYGFDKEFLGFHPNPELKTKLFLHEVKSALETSKPILVEEFGAANGLSISDQDTIGSMLLQANIYKGIYQAIFELDDSQIIGAVAFQAYKRTERPDAWAIIGEKGNELYPAANVLKAFAKNESQKIVLPKVNNNSFLLTTNQSSEVIKLKVGDLVGLKIIRKGNENLELEINKKSLVKTIDDFHFDSSSRYYYGLYSVEKAGALVFKIKKVQDCRSELCTTTMQEFNINVED